MGSQRKLNDTHLSHKQINIPFTGALKVKVGSTFWSTLAISTCLGIHGTGTEDLDRRKFRSQTSDNMDRWNSRGGKSQRGEEQKREDQRRERVRRKKMQVRENQGKPRNTMFFQ